MRWTVPRFDSAEEGTRRWVELLGDADSPSRRFCTRHGDPLRQAQFCARSQDAVGEPNTAEGVGEPSVSGREALDSVDKCVPMLVHEVFKRSGSDKRDVRVGSGCAENRGHEFDRLLAACRNVCADFSRGRAYLCGVASLQRSTLLRSATLQPLILPPPPNDLRGRVEAPERWGGVLPIRPPQMRPSMFALANWVFVCSFRWRRDATTLVCVAGPA